MNTKLKSSPCPSIVQSRMLLVLLSSGLSIPYASVSLFLSSLLFYSPALSSSLLFYSTSSSTASHPLPLLHFPFFCFFFLFFFLRKNILSLEMYHRTYVLGTSRSLQKKPSWFLPKLLLSPRFFWRKQHYVAVIDSAHFLVLKPAIECGLSHPSNQHLLLLFFHTGRTIFPLIGSTRNQLFQFSAFGFPVFRLKRFIKDININTRESFVIQCN